MLDLVSQRGFIALTDLTRQIDASESTIRRDLDYWHQQGIIKRARGGAIYRGDDQGLPALEDRTTSQQSEKKWIAHVAAQHIQDGDTILLDGGTTTLEIAKLLIGRPVQIVTNSLPIANLFASAHETDLIMLGGYVYPKTGVALGPLTIRMMNDLHVHQTFLGISGITERGLFNSNLLLVETERQMMHCAEKTIVVADHTKIRRSALAFLCPLSEVSTLITDQADAELATWTESAGVRLIEAGPPERLQR